MKITIPKSINTINDSTFTNCKSLTSITIPSSITIIEYGAFMGCEKLQSVVIPSTVKNIYDCAFGYLDYFEEKITNFKIYCTPDSAGEKYAKDNGFDYETLKM